ncbi:hypothetical protein Tco_1416848, partial [Tanacetum coccineum]
SDLLFVVQLRVVKLEKDVSKLKKIDHSAKALATLKSQVLTIVEQYLGSKIGNDLQKIQKPTIDLEQESKKSSSEILKIKREQAKKQKMSKYTIKSTDKAALKEYDLKSALYQTMHKNKSFNKNLAIHALYHALMKALIEDENVIDKGVVDTIKNHKRQQDDDDNDGDEDPSAGPNQGKKTKSKSAFANEPVEELIAKVAMDDAVDTAVKDVPWFNQMVSATTDPLTLNDLKVTPIGFYKYVLNRLKIDNLTQDLLLRLAYNLLNGTCTSSIEHEYNFHECFNALTNKLDWNNLEGDRYPFDLSKPLLLQGRPGHLTVAADYFFNNDLEFLKKSNLKKTYTTSITKTKAPRYEIVGIKDMVPTLWSTIKHAYDKDAAKGIKH